MFGAGPIGLAIAKLLSRRRPVLLTETSASRREFARVEGPLDAIAPTEINRPLPSILIDATCHPSVKALIESLAEPSSTIVLVGGPLDLDGRTILTRELEVRAVMGGRGLYPESVSLAATGFDTTRWTQATIPFDRAPAFFEKWATGEGRPFRAAVQIRD